MRAPLLRRAGMTLVELLVVVAIIGLLAVTVLPNVSTTVESRRSREAVRMVSSYIAKAQSRAVGRREWSGFMLMATNTSSSYAAVDLFLADVPPVYRGDTAPAHLRITGSTPNTRTASGVSGSTNELGMSGTWTGGAGVRGGDQIRFNGGGPWYEISSGASAVTGTSIRFAFRGSYGEEDAGYTSANTPWPPSTANLAFEILRQPVPAGSPMSLGDGRAVDLYWSGYGPPQPLTFSGSSYRPFASGTATSAEAGASTSVLFDGTGRLRQVVCTGTSTLRQTVTGPVYLLVGRADRAGQPPFFPLDPTDDSKGANWQYQDSHWVAIDPASGIVKTAPCVPNPFGATDLEKCVNSQAWIRQALLGDGR